MRRRPGRVRKTLGHAHGRRGPTPPLVEALEHVYAYVLHALIHTHSEVNALAPLNRAWTSPNRENTGAWTSFYPPRLAPETRRRDAHSSFRSR